MCPQRVWGPQKPKFGPGAPFWPKMAKMAKNGQKWPKMAKNGPKSPKSDFFDFQSVYTQNDRNFSLILNLSLIFEKKIDQNGQKWPKITKNDFF